MEIEVSGDLVQRNAGRRRFQTLGGQAWRFGALFEDFAGDNANN
jgi:hypothetical protein